MTARRAIAFVVSVALIAVLLWRVDVGALLANLRATRWGLFAGALLLFVPQIVVIALRWKRLVAPFTPLSLGESVRLVLAGASMNLLLPGKLGDLTKGWFLARQGHVSVPLGLGVVVFEKMLDVAALAVFMLIGVGMLLAGMISGEGSAAAVAADTMAAVGSAGATVTGSGDPSSVLSFASLILAAGLGLAAVGGVALLYFFPLDKLPGFGRFFNGNRNSAITNQTGDNNGTGDAAAAAGGFAVKVTRLMRGSHTTMATLRARGARRGEIVMLSFVIWILHLAQICLFFASVNALPGAADFFCMVPLAIFIGLIPISIAGFGTRDAALVTLLSGVAPSAVLAASFYVNLRYILPALAGLPFLARYTFLQRDKEKMASGQNI